MRRLQSTARNGAARSGLPALRSTLARLLFAHFVANLALQNYIVIASWLVFEMTGSSEQVSFVFMATYAPRLVLTLLSGRWADRGGHRRVALAGQSVSAIGIAALLGIALAGGLSTGMLVFGAFALGTGSAIGVAAYQALIAGSVPPARLPSAVALSSTAVSITRAVGPVVAGVLLSTFGGPTLFVPVAVFVGLALAILVSVSPTTTWEGSAEVREADPGEAAAGVGHRDVLRLPGVWAALAITATFAILSAAVQVLLPSMAAQLGMEATGYTTLLAAFGAGAVVSGLVRQLDRVRERAVGIPRLLLGFGALMSVMGLSSSWVVAMPALFLLGGAWVLVVSSLNAGIQLAGPPGLRATAASLFLFAFNGLVPLGAFLSGALGESVGVQRALVAMGAMLAASGAVFILRSRVAPESIVRGIGWGAAEARSESGRAPERRREP